MTYAVTYEDTLALKIKKEKLIKTHKDSRDHPVKIDFFVRCFMITEDELVPIVFVLTTDHLLIIKVEEIVHKE